MQAVDLLDLIEIGERARDAQHAMIAPRGKLHGIRDVARQAQTPCIGARHVFEHGA